MLAVLTGLHVLICIGLIIVVLLQTGKGAGMASVFGGGGGGALVGGKGFGGILAKATAALAIAFMLTSITLSLMPRGGHVSSVREGLTPAEATGPAEQGVTPEAMPQGSMPDDFPSDASPQPAETPAETPAQSPSGQ
jgi:preprotein translocase subunit SecG